MLFILVYLCCLHINCHWSVNIICNLPLLGGADISICLSYPNIYCFHIYNICTCFRINTCLKKWLRCLTFPFHGEACVKREITPKLRRTTQICGIQARGRYHGGRPPSSDDNLHSLTVTPPSTLDKPSITKRYHRRRTCSHTSTRRSPTMVTLHDTRFVECRWWSDG